MELPAVQGCILLHLLHPAGELQAWAAQQR